MMAVFQALRQKLQEMFAAPPFGWVFLGMQMVLNCRWVGSRG
jgi:hypothetical protein